MQRPFWLPENYLFPRVVYFGGIPETCTCLTCQGPRGSINYTIYKRRYPFPVHDTSPEACPMAIKFDAK